MPKDLKTLNFSLCVLCFAALTACGPVDDRVEITQERVLPDGHEAPPLGKNLRERMIPISEMKSEAMQPQGGLGGADLAELFEWETPEGWTEAETTAMRVVNMRFGEGDVGECYLTILTGGGGGLLANVSRWYGQMGLEAPSAEELAALPRAPFINRPAVAVDIEGTFSAMGSAPKPDHRLVGRLLAEQQSGETSISFFMKMTGPKQVVADNLEKFEQFCASFKPNKPAPTE